MLQAIANQVKYMFILSPPVIICITLTHAPGNRQPSEVHVHTFTPCNYIFIYIYNSIFIYIYIIYIILKAYNKDYCVCGPLEIVIITI